MNLETDIKRKATVRVSKKDLQKLLSENEQMAVQITALQARMTELVEENRKLKSKTDEYLDESFPPYDPNIYFDGANGLNK